MLKRTEGLHARNVGAWVVGRTFDEDGSLFMEAWTDRKGIVGGTYDLYRVKGSSGRGRVFARGNTATRDWIMHPDGRILARVDMQDRSDRFRIFVPKNGENGRGGWTAIYEDDTALPNATIYGPNESGSKLIMGGRFSHDRWALYEISLETGEISGPIYDQPKRDVNAIIDPYSGAVVGSGHTDDLFHQTFFDLKFQRVQSRMKATFPDQHVILWTWSKNLEQVIVQASRPGAPGAFYYVDLANNQAVAVGRQFDAITDEHVMPVRALDYAARDGFVLRAYLTLPKDQPAENLPLVALPHGGPEARDTMAFDYWAQFLASRGYAVIQPQFRGSGGFGKDFARLGYGEWGGLMQDDVTDAVKYLAAKGIADPDRVCIAGGSYGGYAALAGATFTPDLYRCAVSINGVSDLVWKMGDSRRRFGGDSGTSDYWRDSMGEDREHLKARSPALHADQVQAPVLIIHGRDDTVVPFIHGTKMRDALVAAGRTVDFVELEGEDHWLSLPPTRISMLKELEGFLDQHIGSGWTPSAGDQEASAAGAAGVN